MSIESQRHPEQGTCANPTPRVTPRVTPAVTPRETPLGRAPTTSELSASGRKAMTEWSPSTKPERTRE
jgi:hypothetical protein